ncbi:MAG: corrinoid protein [Thermodesulfobacteriota bacterium]|nr:corrinoid protein [Thermodesulfobacteriota bacterium]
MADLVELGLAVKEGNRVKAKELTQDALDEGIDFKKIMTEGLISGMTAIGELFGAGEVYMPEVLMSARAMKESMELILPLLASSGFDYVAEVAMGTVKDDIHDIGKNIVAAVFTGSGFKVNDLGVNVAPDKFVEAVKQGAQVVGMSALIGPTMPNMKLTIEALEKAGVRSKVKVIIGGALVTQDYAEKIGADLYAEDAFSGVNKLKELFG